tara:strand:- start:334 stop:1275 length:942 start_codon:yes stop_codon:yes gene_type:complete
MKKKNFFLFTILIFLSSTNVSNSSLETKILAKVENQFISTFELKNKIKLILFLTNQQINQSNVNNTKREALDNLINIKLKKEEILKYNLTNNSDLRANKYFINLSKKYNTDLTGFKKILDSNGIDYDLFFEEIKIEMAWQKIIYNIYKEKIKINDNEIEKELRNIINREKKSEEYKLSEIEILIGNESSFDEKIEAIKKQINEIGFENTAIKFSSSATALNSGDLGWINSNSLSKKVLKEINKIKKGEVSEPIVQGNSILFLKLVDKRTNKNNVANLEEIKKQIISSKQNDILDLYSNNHLSKIRNEALIEIK